MHFLSVLFFNFQLHRVEKASNFEICLSLSLLVISMFVSDQNSIKSCGSIVNFTV
jgi:hypothetical protein